MINNAVTPKLSVIIPVYNVLNYVKEAIDSILFQSEKPDEIIIVDDGSTDGSGELVEELYGSNPLVKIIHTVNRGLGEARNIGTKAASGDYIYYFDSDDIAVDGLVKNFFENFHKHKDMDIFAFSAESFIDKNVSIQSDSSLKPVRLISYRRNMESVFPSGEDAFVALSKNRAFIPNAWLYIYARRLHQENKLFFLPIIHEDEEFTPRLFFKAKKVFVTDKVFFKRRIRMGSIMQSSRSERNAIGYFCACEALGSLMEVSQSKEVQKYLRLRISANIINAIGVEKLSNVVFTPKTQTDLDKLISRYKNFDIWLAKQSYLSWRIFNFVLKKIGAR
nr:glycosyltransferase [Pantoea sp. 201603H]